MAFVSYTYDRYDPTTNQFIYTLVDSDFGEVGGGSAGGAGGVVVREYSKRGLPVGKNLALLVLYDHKQYGDGIADLKRWQDEYCPQYVENWDMYAKDRDRHLEKLLALL